MGHIPDKLRKKIAAMSFYRTCARYGLHGHECEGRITFEHALIYAGKQIQKEFAIIPLCEKAHSVGRWQDCGDLDKNINEWIAISRASDEELLEISRAKDYFLYRHYLIKKYGVYKPVEKVGTETGIDYGHRGDNSSLIHR